MAKVSPWYSIRQRDPNVFHDNDQCPKGALISQQFRKTGRRCRQQCPECARLAAELGSSERRARLTPL
jgi:ssDNA-binding Zn-finger/Zn-ribbon topoisomerase 1